MVLFVCFSCVVFDIPGELRNMPYHCRKHHHMGLLEEEPLQVVDSHCCLR